MPPGGARALIARFGAPPPQQPVPRGQRCTALRFVPERGRRLTLACAAHRGAMSVMYEGVPSRECQACRTFHPVEEFHKDNKTCSWRLSRRS